MDGRGIEEEERKATPEERRLWLLAMKDAEVLPGREIITPEEIPPPPPLGIREPLETPPPKPALAFYKPPPELELGKLHSLDKRNAERLKEGRMLIDARLDLHGLSQEMAHMALSRFIEREYSKGSRCLLVITGKGQGILQKGLLDWLNFSNLRGMILAINPAQPQHGGGGAYYVLLKRKR